MVLSLLFESNSSKCLFCLHRKTSVFCERVNSHVLLPSNRATKETRNQHENFSKRCSVLKRFLSKLINWRNMFRANRRNGAPSSPDGRREASSARLPHCCLVVESISPWLPVSEGRCGKPCADITCISHWGGQLRRASSNTPDRSAPSVHSRPPSLPSRPRRR